MHRCKHAEAGMQSPSPHTIAASKLALCAVGIRAPGRLQAAAPPSSLQHQMGNTREL